MNKPSIAIFVSDPTRIPEGQALANCLQLPCLTQQTDQYDFFLLFNPDFLGLQKNGSPSNPIYIDFLSGKMHYRRKHASLRGEILARALGLKNKTPRTIVDATTGLARDSFILASLGFEVQMLERSPIIHALIDDAIQRASHDSEVRGVIQRMHLIHADAATWLVNHPKPEIIYLDPMFPQGKKSALSKQDMRIFHEVIGDDLDADHLLHTALTCATQRVVVKRPRLAEPLAGLAPTLSMEGSSNRFDIYLTRAS